MAKRTPSSRVVIAGVLGLLICCLVTGCPFPTGPCTTPTYVAPDDGQYSSQDGTVQFTVFTQDAVKMVLYRGLFAEVVDGVFFARKGDIGGTDCPTDGFEICGHFTATDTAEGTITPLRDCAAAAPPSDWIARLGTCTSCAAALAQLIQQASTAPNQIIEAENGTGAGQTMTRSNARGHTTVLLKRGQSRTFTFTLAAPATCTFAAIYSDDEPGTIDQISLTVNGTTQTLPLVDTKGCLAPGDGWNNFCATGLTTGVNLAAGQSQMTLTLAQSDEVGAEIDAVLVFVSAPPTTRRTVTV